MHNAALETVMYNAELDISISCSTVLQYCLPRLTVGISTVVRAFGNETMAHCKLTCACRIYWMNPLQYAQKAILINEFSGGELYVTLH